MKAIVLGAAAGGGFPQWNSNAAACNRARRGDPAARPRTQASLAVSADGRHWFLLNASPDLRQQIESTPALQPREGLRSSPIAGVVLTGGDVDAIAGLLTLRERQPLTVWATARVHGVLKANPVFEVLNAQLVRRDVLALEQRTPLVLPGGEASGLTLQAFSVPGKVPLYLEGDAAPPIVLGEDTIGVCLDDGRARLFYIPGCAAMTPELSQRLRGADLVFFDGTLYRDDEMVRAGLGTKTGRRMGHMSLAGEDGTISAFAGLDVKRKILVHINNSNPALLDDSPERAELVAAGWTVAHDGLEIVA
ncbi:MAG TPA: pyrroloquinoline quinone biosynthesis protein PqqB [Nevskiaceae bacterium]|nr:pyrroloquinoline quinone biosynthesis protein PqqB [Nevskiaceae bacterium]